MTEVLKSYETFISTSTQKSLIKMNSFFGIFAVPKGLDTYKIINERSTKLL